MVARISAQMQFGSNRRDIMSKMTHCIRNTECEKPGRPKTTKWQVLTLLTGLQARYIWTGRPRSQALDAGLQSRNDDMNRSIARCKRSLCTCRRLQRDLAWGNCWLCSRVSQQCCRFNCHPDKAAYIISGCVGTQLATVSTSARPQRSRWRQ